MPGKNKPMKLSDKNMLALGKRFAYAFNQVGLLSDGEKDAAERTPNVNYLVKIIGKPEMIPEQKMKFCDFFVGDDLTEFNGATPEILADAYRAAILDTTANESNSARAQKIADRIDVLSADFAHSGGMIVGGQLIDITNMINVYSGFADMLHARIESRDSGDNTNLGESQITQMNDNLGMIESFLDYYDFFWGITKIDSQSAMKLSGRWKDLYYWLSRADIFDDTKKTIAKYKFLGPKNNIIPQFQSIQHMTPDERYSKKRQIDKLGRIATVIELARHDVAKRHVGKIHEKIDKNTVNALERELNNEIVYKLYKMSVADKLVDAAVDDASAFATTPNRDEIIRTIGTIGGSISDMAYNTTLKTHANATSVWMSRIKMKSGVAAPDLGKFFDDVIGTLGHMDVRTKKRMEFSTRVLKGTRNAFVADAMINDLVTSSGASVKNKCFTTAFEASDIQINRWKMAQWKQKRPTAVKVFTANKHIIASLGAGAGAAMAMCMGTDGLLDESMALMCGAMILGGVRDANEKYQHARDTMSDVESLAWVIENAGKTLGPRLSGYKAQDENTPVPEKTLTPEIKSESQKENLGVVDWSKYKGFHEPDDEKAPIVHAAAVKVPEYAVPDINISELLKKIKQNESPQRPLERWLDTNKKNTH